MRTRFHRFLLIVMMLALPLQTFASAAMIGCALTRHADLPVQMTDMEMSGCHESAPQPDTAPEPHACSHCAACYLASIPLIPAPDTLPVLPQASPAIPHLAAPFSGFIPDGPERPPRTSHA